MFIQRPVKDTLDLHCWCRVLEKCGWPFTYVFTDPTNGKAYSGASHESKDADTDLLDREYTRSAY